MAEQTVSDSRGLGSEGPAEKRARRIAFLTAVVALGLFGVAMVTAKYYDAVSHWFLITGVVEAMERSGVRGTQSAVAADAVVAAQIGRLTAYAVIIVLTGAMVGATCAYHLARRHLRALRSEGEEELSKAFRAAEDKARSIAKVLTDARLGGAYLMSEAGSDLERSNYTFVFGKLTFLLSEQSNLFLKNAVAQNRWKEKAAGGKDEGIVFFLPGIHADKLVGVCRRLRGMGLGSAAFRNALAWLVADESDAFPVQVVMFAQCGESRIRWNASTITTLLDRDQVGRIDATGGEFSLSSASVRVETVAFLDELVSACAGGADQTSPSPVLRDLIGLRVGADADQGVLRNVFARYVNLPFVPDRSQRFLSLERILAHCEGVCPKREECSAAEGLGWRSKCDLIKSDSKHLRFAATEALFALAN